MPTTFHDRERAFEAKFAHDEEFRFLVVARRDKLFAQWAATQLKLSEAATEALVKAVLHISDGPGHDRAVSDHVAGMLAAGEVKVSDIDLAAALNGCRQQAFQQLSDAPPHFSDGV